VLAQSHIGQNEDMHVQSSQDAPTSEVLHDGKRTADQPDLELCMSDCPDAELERKPKVFLSHASSDKERVVRFLDQLLRERGIDVWLDERDLLPGRNLVQEIFTHGISKADVVVVVLSSNSIDRPWVTEELSVAVVQKINGVVKMIIPVVIDGVHPPESLAATVWERIPDLGKLNLHADRIAASVIGATPAPVAPKPAYAGIPVHKLAGLNANDERIFVIACEQLLAKQTAYPLVALDELAAKAQELGMSEEQVYESVEALEQQYFFHDVTHCFGEPHPPEARVTHFAFDRYLQSYRANEYRKEKISILSAIVNRGADSSLEIAQELAIHEYIVDHVLEGLESSGQVNASHSTNGIHIIPKTTLARLLREMENDA
jgi:TIR domain